jgi:hypothetical protein
MRPNHLSFLFLVVVQAIKLYSPVDVVHPDTPWISLLLAALYGALEEEDNQCSIVSGDAAKTIRIRCKNGPQVIA